MPILAQATPYIEIARLSDLPNPLAPIETEFQILAFTICVAGFIAHIWANKDNPSPELATFLRLSIVVAVIAFLGPLQKIVTDVFYYFPEKLIRDGHGINTAGDRIRAQMAEIYALEADDPSFMSLFKISFASLVSNFLATLFSSIAFLGSVVLIPIYFIQHFAVLLGFGGMPIAVSLFALPAMKDKAANYVLSVLSVLSWPFFLVILNIAAGYMLDMADSDNMPAAWGFFGAALVPALAALVLIAGSMAVPLFAYFLFTTGGGYLPPGTAMQTTQMAGGMGGLTRALRGMGRGGAS